MSHARALALAAALLLAAPAGAATLKADYRFDGTLSSSVTGAPDLEFLIPDGQTPADPGNLPVFTSDGMSWEADRGLQLSTAGLVDRSAYSVVLRFKVVSNTCYVRILGFRDPANLNDRGLYSCDGKLYAYNYQQAESASLTDDTFAEVAFTRAADGTLKAYTNGVLQLTTTDGDPAEYQLLEDTLRLFRDDGSEESNGIVSRLRVYDGTLGDAQVADIAAGNSGMDSDGDGVLDSADGCDDVASSNSDGCPSPAPAPQQTEQPAPFVQTPAALPLPAGALRSKGRTVTATCAALAPCTLTVLLKAGKATLGRATATLAPGQVKKVTVALSKKGKKKLRKASRLKATLTAALTQTGGTAVAATSKLTLRT
jgi:hypothetical protein